MNNTFFKLAKLAYSEVLRALLKNALDNPDSELDEFILKVFDSLFDYHSK